MPKCEGGSSSTASISVSVALNVVVVVVVVQQDDLLNLYTWFSYSSQDNCVDVKNVVLINQWVMEGDGTFVREGSLYPCKIPSNFHGCTVNLPTNWKCDFEDEFIASIF